MKDVIAYPLISEKAVHIIESENKITFIVGDMAKKDEIKKAVEGLYNVKVDKVNIIRDCRGRKKALVKLNKQFKASELAAKLKVI